MKYNELSKEDRKFLGDIAYFWRQKGDIERYTHFDLERLRKLDPIMHTHWVNYKVAMSMLDSRSKEYDENV